MNDEVVPAVHSLPAFRSREVARGDIGDAGSDGHQGGHGAFGSERGRLPVLPRRIRRHPRASPPAVVPIYRVPASPSRHTVLPTAPLRWQFGCTKYFRQPSFLVA